MVKVTLDLLRKRAEHHEGQLAPLREITLHQESIENIECIQECCPKLQILLLQSNIISKIENLHKLKELEYLNLAINNIEKVENLERCESLQKLDLTLNFIGEITSLKTLQNNYNLKLLFLTGNPCTDYEGYRKYVITLLPQLEELDNEEIKRSERIVALQCFEEVQRKIIKQEGIYKKKRLEQKIRLEKKIERTGTDKDLTEEEIQRFWKEKCEHSPEVRIEMERLTQLKRDAKKPKEETKSKRSRPLFATDGRPYNINEAKIPFVFKNEDVNQFELEVQLYKHLDTSLVEIDLQPLYIRLTVKKKIFQLALPEEINITDSTAKRSQMTGYLLITMKKFQTVNYNNMSVEKVKTDDERNIDYNKINSHSKREFLEIGRSENILDLTKIANLKSSGTISKRTRKPVEDSDSSFQDDVNVPPLI